MAAAVAPLDQGPVAQSMAGEDPNLKAVLGNVNGLLVKQTMRGCIQECLGCEAKSEFNISTIEYGQVDGYRVDPQALNNPDIMYALEESNFCCRLCLQEGRAFDLQVSAGGGPGGQPLAHYIKPCGFPLAFNFDGVQYPCCCLLPKVDTTLGDGTPIGSESKYICDACLYVPKLRYYEQGQHVYTLRPETCCFDCCIACNCKGKGCIYIPFYFHDPVTMMPIGGEYGGETTPQIRKVWAGFKKELCSSADTFVLMFPPGIDANRKAGLLGLTFLLDFSVFEKQNGGAE